jgi:hypothetical protein
MPNWAHVHLMINHIPVIGFPLVGLVLATGLVRRSRDLVLTGLALAVLLAGASFAVKQSGERAEEVVEPAAWASEARIHDHEEAGERATIAALVTGLVAALAWLRARGQAAPGRQAPGAVLALVLVTSALMAWALEGGPIRHDEIASPPAAREAEAPEH